MIAEKVFHQLTYPLVQIGIYKNEATALTDMALEFVTGKIHHYAATIQTLEQKYHQNFEQFTAAIKHTATYADEEDWMDWKGALEMQRAWKHAQQKLLTHEHAN